jgi:xanthine dehydrogenase accessory factor
LILLFEVISLNRYNYSIIMRELLRELTSAMDQGRDCVYCSLVETRGSTPQKAGAAMLVYADGGQFGTLGGGCVEAEVKQRALRVLGGGDSQPEILTFHLDDNYGWDDGLICGGRMAILADPVILSNGRKRSEPSNYYRRYQELIEKGQGCTEAVILTLPSVEVPIGSRFLFGPDGRLEAQSVPAPLPSTVAENLVPLGRRPQAGVRQGIAYLPILPRITLFVVGGGHVAKAVSHLAADVDFDIWVLDDRESFASRQRFPKAQKLFVGDIGSQLQSLLSEITPSFFCIIVTRGHAHDEEALYHLVRSKAGYVGMIGSKRKIKMIYEDLQAKGIRAEDLQKVHAPLGFAIGSQTVDEIAVSIVAELIACRNLGQTIPAARIHVPI